MGQATRGKKKRESGFNSGAAALAFDRLRLEVAADLANAPPIAEWTPEQLRKVSDERLPLAFFHTTSSRTPPTGVTRSRSHEWSASRDEIAAMRDAAQRMLTDFLEGKEVSVSVSAEDLADGALVVQVGRKHPGKVSAIAAPMVKAFEMNGAFLLASELGAQLRRCADKKCGHIFVRTRKREYCPRGGCGVFCGRRDCANRFHQAQWRESNEANQATARRASGKGRTARKRRS